MILASALNFKAESLKPFGFCSCMLNSCKK